MLLKVTSCAQLFKSNLFRWKLSETIKVCLKGRQSNGLQIGPSSHFNVRTSEVIKKNNTDNWDRQQINIKQTNFAECEHRHPATGLQMFKVKSGPFSLPRVVFLDGVRGVQSVSERAEAWFYTSVSLSDPNTFSVCLCTGNHFSDVLSFSSDT